MADAYRKRLEDITRGLKSQSESDRKRAANLLAQDVEAAYKELPKEVFDDYYYDDARSKDTGRVNVNKAILTLVQRGNNTYERTGGLFAVDRLIDFKGEDAGNKATRFRTHIHTIMSGSDRNAMRVASAVLRHLVKSSGPLASTIVDAEEKAALESLQVERNEDRRFAAVLTLKELAKSSPTLLHPYITDIFEVIWVALRDPMFLIRESAAEAVGECVSILMARDPQTRNKLFTRAYEEIDVGFQRHTVEAIHGSLLALKVLLEKGGMFMHGSRYKEACERVLSYREHRDPLVRHQVVNMIPLLATYAPKEFCNGYIHRSMSHLQGLLKSPKDRNDAFVAIGNIANAVGSQIAPYLDNILLHIREALSPKAREKTTNDAPVFECLSMIAVAAGQTLSKYMEALLDPIFACGLSEALIKALRNMAHFIPPVKPIIQEKLLDLISHTLCGERFMLPGHPTRGRQPRIYTREVRTQLDTQNFDHREGQIALALKTLSSFDFSGHILNEFVRDVAIRYVEDDSHVIRSQAALTCCQLFVQDPIVYQTSHYAIQVVSDVIEKLLTVGVADPDAGIRQTVLQELDTRFDRHLAKAENVRTLFLALNDEVFGVREAAMTIIGRLTVMNPAYVFPSLRKVLIQLLTEIEYSNSAKNKRESACLISHLINSSSRLIKPYVDPMVTVLLPKARDPDPDVASATLKAIGDLSTVGGNDMIKYIPELMTVIIDSLQDLSSEMKRRAALKTLGQLASSSGYVIDPYTEHPELLAILVGIIRDGERGELRHETIRLMGILGALDPYKHQVMEQSPESNLIQESQQVNDVTLIMRGITPSHEDYYPTVVINTLMGMLKEPTLAQHHYAVVEAVMAIYKTMGLKCVGFLGQVVPGILLVIRNASSGNIDGYFNHLSTLVRIVRQHIRPHLPEILTTVQDFWVDHPQYQPTMLSLIEAIAESLEGEFKIYLANVLPLMLGALERRDRRTSERVLHAFLVFGSSAEEYMHLIIPVVVRIFEKPTEDKDKEIPLKRMAIETIGKLSRHVNISEFAAKIIHPLSRVLASQDNELKSTALDTLCALIFQLGPDYIHFIPTVNKILVRHRVPHTNYSLIVGKLQKGEPLPQDLSPDEVYRRDVTETEDLQVSTKKPAVNQQHLKTAWEANSKSTKEDWQEWIRRFSIELLRESPQQALRACQNLATVYTPLARSLFNSAFVSCWTELYDQYQEELVRSIEIALTSPHIPPEILQILLNLAEFMEHDDKALPIDVRTLGMYAGKCHAFAKALHYKELEFNAEQNASNVEALISINNQLQQTDAAFGILRKAQGFVDVQMKETWFEKLQRWEEALTAYQKRERDEPDSFEVIMGKMRCLHALGEWEVLSTLAQEKWMHASSANRKSIAALAAAAAWGMGQWELMDQYLTVMGQGSPDRSFFGAILSIHRNQFVDAQSHIDNARSGLVTELSSLLGESYTRAYSVVVRVQMLAELEEIVQYKESSTNPQKQERMRSMWTKRLMGCQRNVEVWQRMLKVRALVITPPENAEMYIKFASICRKSGRTGLAEKALNSLLGWSGSLTTPEGQERTLNAPYPVQYAVYKFMWSNGYSQGALSSLRDFTERLRVDYEGRAQAVTQTGVNGTNGVNGINGANGLNGIHFPGTTNGNQLPEKEMAQLAEWQQLLARCYLKQGDWLTVEMRGEWDPHHVHDIRSSYKAATHYNQDWYKAWHAWALANFEVVTAMTTNKERETVGIQTRYIHDYVVPAIQGFFKSIALSSSSSLQDTLRLLTLWFNHGEHQEVNSAVSQGVTTVSIDTWLEVIPQLIARINQPNRLVKDSIHHLLCEVGRAHPQALVYPLTVSIKSDDKERSRAASDIMTSMEQHSPNLCRQAALVSHELIRIAVLWHEQWHEGLEEASRLYFGDHDIDGMLRTLEPLHKMLDEGPETLREISFIQSFGRDLAEARDWCNNFKRSGEVGDLNQAWDLYYGVFKRIARQLPQLSNLELTYVSPKLKQVYDLELVVPGTYRSGKPIVRIMSFDPVSTVIQSKQRPRKLALKGSDGVNYTYVVKGHEDIRQDERVMQLFGLVNTLLSHDPECLKRHLNIQRYAAIPLSTQSGLLGWVPNSDTLHVLIKEYRDSRKILLNIEHRIMLQMAPDYDNLTLMQKVEVFGYALDNTTGQDLYRVLWLKSKSSEAWLERRTNYTRSLAVMSMVGYILGLGDRHPSNLMLDRATGKIIHIDFGDCFEVAMHREKYPERVPFRLTRMLTFAMEVSNIEGSFRTTCEHTMRVLRQNKESLVAVLEAFIHDPLLTWRLGNQDAPPEPSFPSERRASIIGEVDIAQRSSSSSIPGRPGGGRGRGSIVAPPPEEHKEVQNARALQVLARVKEKLTGRDFKKDQELEVSHQVEKLLSEATNLENLCQHYGGWCSFW